MARFLPALVASLPLKLGVVACDDNGEAEMEMMEGEAETEMMEGQDAGGEAE